LAEQLAERQADFALMTELDLHLSQAVDEL
jgi:hypothetical protein